MEHDEANYEPVDSILFDRREYSNELQKECHFGDPDGDTVEHFNNPCQLSSSLFLRQQTEGNYYDAPEIDEDRLREQ